MDKLIAGSDPEGVEGVPGTDLGGGIPTKALLPNGARRRAGNGNRGKPAVGTDGRNTGVLFRGDKLDFLIFRNTSVHRFLDQVAKFFLDVMKLRSGYTHEDHVPAGMAEAQGLEPCVVGVPADFFLKRS